MDGRSLTRRDVLRAGGAAALVAGGLLRAGGPAAAAAPPATTVLADSGAWCWFGDPRAVYHRGAQEHTYIGFITATGDIVVTAYDHRTTRRTTAVVAPRLEVDDHDNPSLLVRPDGHLLAFWSRHNGGAMYYRRTARPQDVSSWEPVRTIPTNTPGPRGYTYPNPVQLSAEGNRVYLFWRGGDWKPVFSTFDGGTAPWTSAQRLIVDEQASGNGVRPYLKVASDGVDTIHFAFTEHHPQDAVTSIHYLYYRAGSLYRANGQRIGPLGAAASPGDADKVYDAAAGRERSWIHDIAVGVDGRPVIVYARMPGYRPGTNTPYSRNEQAVNHSYHYARWTGQAWVTHRITAAGGTIAEGTTSDGVTIEQPQYSGGIVLDHQNPTRVYLSRPNPSLSSGRHQIELRATIDGGATWSATWLTSDPASEHVRPFTPRGPIGDRATNVLWMAGEYPGYRAYRTGIVRTGAHPTNPAPTARFTFAPRSGASRTIDFDGRTSTDTSYGSTARVPPALWTWDFGDATSGTGSTISHTYARPGRYFVSLRVTDGHPPPPGNDVLVQEVVVA